MCNKNLSIINKIRKELKKMKGNEKYIIKNHRIEVKRTLDAIPPELRCGSTP